MKILKIVFVLAIMFAAILVPVYAQSDSIEITGTSPEAGFADIDWDHQRGQGETFDLYNVKWNKGTVLKQDHSDSWVKPNNYYLRELAPGPWTFQVCLSENKVVDESSCGNTITVNVKDFSNEKLVLTGSNNEPSYANMDWNDVKGLGTNFDKYNVRWAKGTSLGTGYADSWISFGSYYNLGNLKEGPWTFQVCLSENKNVFENTCSNIKTVNVKGKYTAPIESTSSSSTIVLTGSNNEPGFANMDWNDLKGLGTKFDKYNVRSSKGTVLNQDPANAWVSYGSYYNLGNLEEGPWTFQVCLSKNKNSVDNTCSNIETVYVLDYPVNYIENEIITAIPELPEVSPNLPLPAEIIPTITTECNNGCSYNDKCLPIGTRIRNSENKFCSWDGTMQPQITPGLTCQNDYECSTNSCLSGLCTDLSGQLQEQNNLLERILGWLSGRFR
ncbi:hypothetical protein HQ489_05955 [Candidatus Woesearchaeota archaeon]|nr:hypothetical protein [Candidatus Woesearchaeota archaeon]